MRARQSLPTGIGALEVDGTRILHVIESFGGGSANAMRQFVKSVPEARHSLLRGSRDGEHLEGESLEEFVAIRLLPKNPVKAALAIRRAVAAERPDIIHAHSSMGGAAVRLAVLSNRRHRIVYSPHCFAFERRDLSPAARSVFAAVEWLLALNTWRIAACSERERTIACALPARADPVHVPNTASSVRPVRSDSPAGTNRVVGLGRLGPQKDPAYFLAVVQAIRSSRPDMEATWIGGGPAGTTRQLEQAGVRVTGWLGPEGVAAELNRAGTYIHTAAWEGFPLAILEAAAAGLAVVARRIPALTDMPGAWTAVSPEEVGAAAIRSMTSAGRSANVSDWCAALSKYSPSGQRRALIQAYQRSGRPRARRRASGNRDHRGS